MAYVSLFETLGVVTIKLTNGAVFEMLQSSKLLAQLVKALAAGLCHVEHISC